MFQIFNRFTLDSIGEIGFGQNLGTLQLYPAPHAFLGAFDRAQFTTMERFFDPTWTLGRLFRLGREGEMIGDIEILRAQALAVVRDQKDKFARGETQGGDFLSLFMQRALEEGTEIDDQFLVDVCLNFIIAGRDTTACALSWTFFELSQHPDVLAKCRAEIDEVLNGDELSFDDINNFEYLRAVQNETLRLHPSVPRDSRMCAQDDVLPDGTIVKAGTNMGYSAYGMGRDPKLWGPDCELFRPERWEQVDQSRKDFQFVFPVRILTLFFILKIFPTKKTKKYCVIIIYQKMKTIGVPFRPADVLRPPDGLHGNDRRDG